jgi:hypothetical protein
MKDNPYLIMPLTYFSASYGCNTDKHKPHPHYKQQIKQMACGYDKDTREQDVRCTGCVRKAINETPDEQIAKARSAIPKHTTSLTKRIFAFLTSWTDLK